MNTNGFVIGDKIVCEPRQRLVKRTYRFRRLIWRGFIRVEIGAKISWFDR